MSETWLLLKSPAGSAAHNMAVDNALLLTASQRQHPLLRLYSWSKPAASFGYFQNFPAHLAATHQLVRRPTGGGLVYHGGDTTYTVIVPPRHALYRMSVAEAYTALHEAVATALELRTQLAAVEPTSPHGSYECFQSPVAGDVMADGRKLAGGAQRRTKHGMLHQGSIAARVSDDRLVEAFRTTLDAVFLAYSLTDEERVLVRWLEEDKFAQDGWNRRVV